MKYASSISTIIFLSVIMAGCGRVNRQSTCDWITVDVNAKYPEKKLLLQDFMDVEYVPLETSDEFITQGGVKAVGKDIILIANRNIDGDIFIFDRKTGKGLRKINHLGQGPEEYTQFTDIVLDEENREIFVVAYSARNILVYDLYGNFKRMIKFDGDTGYYNYTFNYDKGHLISHKGYLPGIETERSRHILLSKQDGSITREIPLPFIEIKTPVIIEEEGSITPGFYLTIPNRKDWIIMRTSSDTIYNYSPDNNTATPVIIRTPTIASMNPEIFLFPTVITDRYYFMRTMKKEIDLTTFKGFPGIDLMYDKQENSIFEYSVYNDDFSSKQQISLGQTPGGSIINQEIATCILLNAFDLVEALKNNDLKGDLKDIAQGLNEESNPVIMLIKHKK